jgi:phage major head subunit gpT-like protein
MTTLELTRRGAALAPTTFDEKTNTVEAVVSTGADVRRPGYIERLPVANANLRGFVGKPVLDAHSQASTRAVLGVIERAWIADGELRVLIKLSSRDDVTGTVRDIRDGIIRSLSVGYQVLEWAESTNSKGERVRTARAWIPHEVSFVPIGADPGAVTRSSSMEPEIETPETPAPTPEQVRAQTRAEVRDIIKRAGGTPAQADELIDRDATPEQAHAAAYEILTARSQAYEILTTRSQAAPRVRVINPGPSPEETQHRRAAGFAASHFGVAVKDEAAKPFVGLSVEDHARDHLESLGVRTRGMSRDVLLSTAFQTRSGGVGQHTTSDFPLMLDIGLSTAVRAAYEAASSPLVALCFKATANDFRTQYAHQLGEFPKLSKVTESGEIKNVTRGEARESWSLDTYGALFSASRKLILNDAFNQLGDFARDAGQAAAATTADLVVQALTQSAGAGPVMGDTVRLFHADHGNLDSSGASIALESLSAARVAMITQTGVDGETIINVKPDTIVVPPSQLTAAEQFVATIQPGRTDDANPFGNKLAVVCEPRLEAIDPLAWYLADSRHPALVLGGLAGYEGPQVSARDGWEILSREWRVTLDVGVGPRDWRGWYRNVGSESA